MISTPGWRKWLKELVQPSTSPELEKALKLHRESLPVLWLLGKTGAGKSSVVQRLTGDSRATIGNGFAPCTRTAMLYEHPSDAPVVRFLDTRGLGESDYDPTDDLACARSGSHALLLLTRVDDSSQAEILETLRRAKSQLTDMPVLHIHTALHTLGDENRTRAIEFNRNAVADALGRQVPDVEIDFTAAEDGFENDSVGLDALRSSIINLVPDLANVLRKRAIHEGEEALFLTHRTEILGYSGAAAAADVFPAVGLFAVPSIQGKLLHALAGRYDISWDRRVASEFVAALGSGFLYRYALSLGGRQLAKFIPVYGQSAGAAAAATVSFASTYAIGRTACLYFYRKKNHQSISTETLQQAFKSAFDDRKKA